MSLYYIIRKKYDKINKYIRIFITLILINIGWILFRANNISDSYYILTHIFSKLGTNLITAKSVGLGPPDIILSAIFIILLEIVQLINVKIGIRKLLSARPAWIQWAVYIFIIILMLLFGVFNNREFIYFQF